MKTLFTATAAAALLAGALHAEEVKIGVMMGFTGPIESLTPSMAESAELAMKEVSDSGLLLDGTTLTPVRADSTCIDSAAATTAAERLVTTDGVVAFFGPDCSGVTGAVLSNVAMPNGVPVVSPSATSPALSAAEDNGLFFRTVPSDSRQGEVLADILIGKGINDVAVTYTNNDYGKGFSDAFREAFEGQGGTITLAASHDDGKADYSAEIGALASAGGEILVVLGYADQGGAGMIRAALDTGAFDTFALGDGMYADSLLDTFGDDLEGTFGAIPWAEGEGPEAFNALAEAAGINAQSAYTRESYDAAALIALAMAKGGAATSEAIAANIMDVANAPGEKILPGELGKALEILAAGGDVDYVGGTNVELIDGGEAAGTYREWIVQGGEYTTVQMR